MRLQIAFVSVALTCLAGGVTAASAHPWGPYGVPWQEDVHFADDSSHNFCFESSVGSGLRDLISNEVKDALGSSTHMTAPQVTCSSSTDVRFASLTASPVTWRGIYECQSVVSGQTAKCNSARVTLNLFHLPDQFQRKKTACHETGHSVGLRHYSSHEGPGTNNTLSCLISGSVPEQSKYIRYSDHEVTNHINDRY